MNVIAILSEASNLASRIGMGNVKAFVDVNWKLRALTRFAEEACQRKKTVGSSEIARM